jgi:hypothetical protein
MSEDRKMTVLDWVAAAQGLVALFNLLQATKPVADTLTPEEKASLDDADLKVSEAVADWDNTSSPEV